MASMLWLGTIAFALLGTVIAGAISTGAAPAAQELPTIPDPVAVTLDPRTTAFLVLDLRTASCPPRPTCIASLTGVAALLERARASGVLVVHSLGFAGVGFEPAEIAPLPTEPVVISNADKFFETDLDQILRSNAIQTTLIVGTSANGAPLYTAFGASQRGYTVVVAEDGLSANSEFIISLARWQLLNQPGFTNPDNTPLRPTGVTLTRTDLVTFASEGPEE